MIRTILFDLDDTLIYEERVVRDTLADACNIAFTKGGINGSDLFQTVVEVAGKEWSLMQGEERWGDMIGMGWWEVLYGNFRTGDFPLLRKLCEKAPAFQSHVWLESLRQSGSNNGALADEMSRTYTNLMHERIIHLPDSVDVLTSLRKKFRLGMITNGAPDVQNMKIDGSGLRKYFDSIVISGEFGMGKPKPEIFRHAMETLASTADECVMIGNSFNRDVKGAIDSDIRAVWMNINGEEPPHANVHFDVIRQLKEIEPLLCY